MSYPSYELSFTGAISTTTYETSKIITDGIVSIQALIKTDQTITLAFDWFDEDGNFLLTEDTGIAAGSTSVIGYHVRARYVRLAITNAVFPTVANVILKTLLFSEPTSLLQLDNTGAGAYLYKKDVQKIRSVISSDTSILITQNTNIIDLKTGLIPSNILVAGSNDVQISYATGIYTVDVGAASAGNNSINFSRGTSGVIGTRNIMIGYNSASQGNPNIDNVGIGPYVARYTGLGMVDNLTGFTSNGGISIGVNSCNYGSYGRAISIGAFSNWLAAPRDKSINIGQSVCQNTSAAVGSINIGDLVNINDTGGENSISIGRGVKNSGNLNVCIGASTICVGSGSVSLGKNINNPGNNSICIGANSSCAGASEQTVVGYNASSVDGYGVCVGRNSQASYFATALGADSKCFSSAGVAIGRGAYASNQYCTVLGGLAGASSGMNTYEILLGYGTQPSNVSGRLSIGGSNIEAVHGSFTMPNSGVPQAYIKIKWGGTLYYIPAFTTVPT